MRELRVWNFCCGQQRDNGTTGTRGVLRGPRGPKKRPRWAGLVFEICKWRLEAPPRLNHQISIPSKGSSARWFGGSFLLHFRGHSVVNLCAYRNLYSWEIPSTKRLDCLGGLIGTPFGDDDQRFVYIKMLQFLLLGLGSWICFNKKR